MTLSHMFLLLLPLTCYAQSITGSVYNGTTGKPDSGAQLTLFTPSGEQGHATTDESGAFSIQPSKHLDAQSFTLLQVVHAGVDYYEPVHSGRTIVTVYEASDRIDGIKGHLSILQFQSKGKSLQVTELHAIDNVSRPPITQTNHDNLVLSLPEGTNLSSAVISAPDGGTLHVPLVAIPGRSGIYRVDFPLKPGRTKYAISYDVPYMDKFVFRREFQYFLERVGIIIPESMRVRGLSPQSFHSVADQPKMRELVLDHLAANHPFAFEISGSGALSRSLQPRHAQIPQTTMATLSSVTTLPASSSKQGITADEKSNTTIWLTLIVTVSSVAMIAALLVRMKLKLR